MNEQFKTSLGKLVRHAIAALAGFAIAHALKDKATFELLISGGCFYLFTVFWSYDNKMQPDDKTRAALWKFSQCVARQALAALAGWMAAHGASPEVIADPAASILFVANWIGSHAHPPATQARV